MTDQLPGRTEFVTVDGMRLRSRLCALVLVASFCTGATAALAQETGPPPRTPDDVLGVLRRTLTWYQSARIAMQAANDATGGLAVREDEQTVLRVLQRAFDGARAETALLEHSGATTTSGKPPGGTRAERRATLETAVRNDEQQLARLRARARSAPPARRATLERDITAISHQLDLERLRLEFVISLEQVDASLAAADLDLAHQIQALQEAVPELTSPSAAPKTATAPPAIAPATSGAWTIVYRLLALQRSRNSLAELALATAGLVHDVDGELQSTRAALRSLMTRLRALATNPGENATTPAAGEQEFHAMLDRVKLLGAVVVPLRAEAALLHRYVNDIERWQRTVEGESRHVMERLALELAGVVVGIVAILVGAVLWRVATLRYVSDPYRRRLLLVTRNVAAGLAVALVLVFHFTSELTALVTALGFAAAGIAFALQNVILSVAGYFSMVAPNGIRVGDRVSLQGPFGYVNGEVFEIGFVRMRLRELASDHLEPTGRIVVFPNSVVFTGSFFKHPAEAARAA
jgi:Mechanosensitive ion channel